MCCGNKAGEAMKKMLFVLLLAICSCSGESVTSMQDVTTPVDIVSEIEELEKPVEDIEAAKRAFKLYYRERVERAVIAFNRYMVFGDPTFAINIRKAGISRKGDDFEVVPGPNDNNSIGASARVVWFAYKLFRTRTLALSLIRMFEGLHFIATMTGHDGITGRNAYPNWTLFIDGFTNTVQRTRDGKTVWPPISIDPILQSEVVSVFFSGVRMKYRGEVEDILLNYMPAQEVGPYAVTYSHTMLPRFLRVSDCCTSLMRVPEPYLWANAYWSNHNSRDNFPDLAFGYLAALEAMKDADADPQVRAAATRAWEAARMVGDSIQKYGGRIMTVPEDGPYQNLVPSGQVRPDGQTEDEDLGSMSDCQMAYLARALSSQGLTVPLPELPEPGALDDLIAPLFDEGSGCLPEGTPKTCKHLADAFCGRSWGNLNELKINGKGLVELAWELERQNPGTAKSILGHFYDNYDQPLDSALGVYEYARVIGDEGLLAEAKTTVAQMTEVSRQLADLIYGNISPAEQANRRYFTALTDAQAGLEVVMADIGDLSEAEQQMVRIESMLNMKDTDFAPLLSEGEIANRIEKELNKANDAVKQRYKDTWANTPPIRVKDNGYEARYYTPDGITDWRPVDRPHHFVLGGIRLLEALPLCVTSKKVLDCTWAVLGCERADLDHDHQVGPKDRALLENASLRHGCGRSNNWCEGADLDHTGSVDHVDEAFMDAALGCWY